MRADITSGRAVGFLLSLIDSEDADRVRARVGLPWGPSAVPASVVLWMLQEDDPDLDAVV